MTQEEKSLLLADLCARLPYGVVVQEPDFYEAPLTTATMSEVFYDGLEIKPYLRPMSSMTEEEIEDFSKPAVELELKSLESEANGPSVISIASSAYQIDWLIKHHFDYRGLIPMGLALPATEDMYKF